MAIVSRLERTFRARFDECGADGFARPSSYLRWAQDVAWLHSERAGFDRAWYTGQRLAWLVRCLELEYLDVVESGTEVAVSTEVVGFRRVWARRMSEVRRVGDRRLLGVVTTDWVLLGSTGVPVRVPQVILDEFPWQVPDFEPARVAGLPVPPDACTLALRVRRHELDPMGHVNHAVYLDWLEETVASAGGSEELATHPRRYRLEYERSAMPGAEVTLAAWRLGEQGWAMAASAGQAELVRGRFRAG